MRRVLILMMLTAAMGFLASPLAAQPGRQGGGLLTSHPNPLHPMEGTLTADLVSVNGASEDARGRATFNYVRGRDEVVVRINVDGLEPNTQYQLHVAVHRVKPVGDLAVFMTDDDGDGVAFVRLDCLEPFNLVNIREPGVPGSRRLTSWIEDGGSFQQTPDRRNKETPPVTCPAS